MSKSEFSKPFNIEHAKAGAPFGTKCGRKMEIFKYDYPMSGATYEPIILGAVYKSDDNAIVTYWDQDGRWFCGGPADVGILVMLPLGMCEGKPVFVGDKLEISAMNTWQPHVARTDSRGFKNCRWPVPAPVYPVTRMTDGDLSTEYNKNIGTQIDGLRDVATAAIARAIEDGDMVLPGKRTMGKEEMTERAEEISLAVSKNADVPPQVCFPGIYLGLQGIFKAELAAPAPSDDLLMKVAKEVWLRATGHEHFLDEKEEYFRIIIASVTSAQDAKGGVK